MPQYMEQKKEHANLGAGEDLKEIITLFYSTVLVNCNALFICSQARLVPAFFEVLSSLLNRLCMNTSGILRSF